MRPPSIHPTFATLATAVVVAAAACTALPAAAVAKPSTATATGTLTQLRGAAGCLVNGPRALRRCTPARALDGPGPFLGSRAIAVSPDGRNVYVASSRSNAIAVLRRNRRTGRLTQGSGAAGLIAAKGAGGCAAVRGLIGPNSVAVSPTGATCTPPRWPATTSW